MFGGLTINPNPYALTPNTVYTLFNTSGVTVNIGTISIAGGSSFLILNTNNNVIGNETTEFQAKVDDGTVDPFLMSGDLIFRIDEVDQTREDFYRFYNEYVPAYERATLLDNIYVKEEQTELMRLKENDLNFKRETIIYQSSYVTQQASSLDTPFYPNYGNVSDIVTDDLTLASNGELTVNVAGQYYIRLFGHFGRDINSGTAISLFWGQIDFGGGWVNIPNSQSKAFAMQNSSIKIPFEYEFFFELPAGVKLRYVSVRDSSGNNDGGLYTFNPNYVGAQPFPSLGVDLSKIVPV